MNRRAALIVLLLAACAGRTPAVRVALPAPVQDPIVVDGDVTLARVRGMQILVRRVPGAEMVAGRLILLGGVRSWGREDAGVGQLAFNVAARGGTESMDKATFTRALARLGSAVFGFATDDVSGLGTTGPLDAWETSFAMLTDAFLHPALPASEIEVQRQAQLVRLRREQEVPDLRLGLMGREALFAGHPYEHRAIGRIDTVSRLSRDDLGKHLEKLRQTGRMVVVVVGDVNPLRVVDQVEAAFKHLPRGDYADSPLPRPRFEKPRLVSESRKLPTNYIRFLSPGPDWRDADFVPAMVSMGILQQREWDEVRSKRNLSYAPSAAFASQSAIPVLSLYVTAVDAPATMKVMLDETRRLQSEPVPDKELQAGRSVFLTQFLMASESMDGQAELLARMHVQGGDWRRFRSLPAEVRAVDAARVQAFARKWLGRWQGVLLGDPAALAPALLDQY